MLTISAELMAAVLAHAQSDHPDEACGIIAGEAGSDVPSRVVPMLNAARSATFYEFDSTELLRLYRQLEAAGEEPIVIYHSHTSTAAYPSRTDISYAGEPNAHYLIISTRDSGDLRGECEIRSFRIVAGDVSEEEIRTVDGG